MLPLHKFDPSKRAVDEKGEFEVAGSGATVRFSLSMAVTKLKQTEAELLTLRTGCPPSVSYSYDGIPSC